MAIEIRRILMSVVLFISWSTATSAADQNTAQFQVVRPGQIPTAGFTRLSSVTTETAIGCARKCWNDVIGYCQGFLFQSTTCNGDIKSVAEAGSCDVIQFSDIESLTFEPVNSTCQHFYAKPNSVLNVQLVYSIPGVSAGVSAMASLNNQLFVTRNQSASSNQIAIYDQSTFQLMRNITVSGATGWLFGLAVDPTNNLVYVSDMNNYKVFKVDLTTSSTINSWAVVSTPRGLSVNRAHNLLVAFNAANKIDELTPNGLLVRTISDSNNLWQAVELNDGTLAVTRWGLFHGICLKAVNGTDLRCYGSTTRGSGPGQMNAPRSFVVHSQGFILVADMNNNRILVVNPTLSDARLLNVPVSITQPLDLWLDESRGRLFVGEWGGQRRLLIFDGVYNIGSLFSP